MTPVARLALGELEIASIVVDAAGTFWISAGKRYKDTFVYRFRETGRASAVPACTGWYVHVLTGKTPNPPTWTYPATQKALQGFPQARELHLVEHDTHMGIPVPSRERGAALLAHLGRAAPELRPTLVCFTPPEKHRDIPVLP